MSDDALRAALLDAADRRAGAVLAAARAEAAAILATAETDAAAAVAAAQARAESEAAQADVSLRAAARASARDRVLRAQGTARAALLRQVEAAAAGLRVAPGYGALLDRLAGVARATLGEGAEIERDPPAGGVVGRRGRLLVDLTLPALVELVVDARAEELDAAWR